MTTFPTPIASEPSNPLQHPGLAVEAPLAANPRRLRRAVAVAVAGSFGIACVMAIAIRAGSATAAAPNAARGDEPAATAVEPDREERTLTGAIGPARQVSISPDGARVFALRDRGVDVWRLDGTHTAWLSVDGDRVLGAAWSSDGTRVLVWGPDGTVRLWNADTAAMVRTIQAGMGVVSHAELTDDTHAVTVGVDGVRRTWDLRTGDVRIERGRAIAPSPLETDAISCDGAWRAFVDLDGGVRIQRRTI